MKINSDGAYPPKCPYCMIIGQDKSLYDLDKCPIDYEECRVDCLFYNEFDGAIK